MKIKWANLIVVFFLLLSVFTASIVILPEEARATTHYVSWTGTKDFTMIQDAIHAASPGDTVFVFNGTYKEQLTITEPISLIGEDVLTTKIEVNTSGPGNTTGHAIYVNTDSVNISGFTMIGKPIPPSPSIEVYGVELYDNQKCRIENSRFQTFRFGVYLWGSSDNHIANNTMINNMDGLTLLNSERNVIVNNTFYANNQDGLRMLSSDNNIIIANNASGNGGDGLHFFSSYGNIVYHNYAFGNTYQASDDGENCWDGCYPGGGNHWADYSGIDNNRGVDQDQPGSDGIGDTPYAIRSGTNEDRYPLMALTFLPSVPTPPLSLNATPGDGLVDLSWEPPLFDGLSLVTNYSIYRTNASGVEVLLTTLGEVFEHTDIGLTNGEPYRYRISAINGVGEGCRSDEVFATPATVPGPPQFLTAQAGIGYVDLQWGAPSDDGGSSIIDYVLYRGTTSGGETLLGPVGNVLTYTDLGVASGQEYYYEVSAVNGVGEGLLSNEASATPLFPPPNEQPICTIDSPYSGSVVYGIIQISGTADDSDGSVEKVEINFDNGTWRQVFGTSFWTYDWNTTQFPNGYHNIFARSFDGENYSDVDISLVIVENAVPDGDGEEDSFGWMGFFIIVVIVGFFVFLVLWLNVNLRKQRREEIDEQVESVEEDEEEPPRQSLNGP